MERKTASTLAINAAGIAVALVLFFPVLWIFLTGFKSEADALAIPPTFFFAPSFEKYAYAFQEGEFLSFFSNTIILVGASVLLSFAFGLPAAFSLAFFPGKRANDILFFALSTKFMPGVAVVVPIYILYTKLHLVDTLFGLVLMHVALGIPIVLWLMRRFFTELPAEIIEAALVDGASRAHIFWKIALPLSIPGLATTAFLLIIMAWNEFFFAVNLAGRSAAPLTVYMASFFTSEGQTWAQMSAAATLSVLPILLLGWIASRGLVRGLTSGSVQ
ncbi:MAG TPA: carbohydrate ABC transporter permease [Dongiaceae bacterium]|jgi:sorbitol/mannitol transport system permease protein|nr:carbohydrate ABC transporter permease [Dongiaceae bacterium]